jgi:hypothetical protein
MGERGDSTQRIPIALRKTGRRLGEELEEAWTLGPDEFAMLAGKLVVATTLVLAELRPNSIL